MSIGLAATLTNEADNFLSSFGGSITYTPSGGSSLSLTGMFKDPYNAVELGDVTESSNDYEAILKTTDIEGVALGDTITVETVVYTIIEIMPGITGLTVLGLEK